MDLLSLRALLTLDKSAYEVGLRDAEDDATSAGGRLSGIMGGIAKVGVAAFGAATTAVGAFAKSSIDVGNVFNSSMSQVAATMGNVDDMSEESFNKLKEYATGLGVAFDDTTTATQLSSDALRAFAQEMGSKTAFSASQAADALNYMALAGYDATTSIDMLPNVLNLAAAGNMDLARASDMVTDTQSALGLSLEETSAMVDQMAKASSKSNTSVEQLGDAMLTIGATARGVKGGTVELSTVLGVLADNGIKASEGGTHLRNAILSLQTPTKDGTEALAKLGMTYADMYDEAGNMRALPEIFLKMQNAMAGMNQQAKDSIIGSIFNKTDLAAINALVGTSAERWNDLATSIENSAGAAEQMAGTQLDNLAGNITIFRSALEGAQIAIADKLTPTYMEFVKLGTESISTLTDAFKKDGVDGLMSSLSDVMTKIIAKVAEVLPELIKVGVGVVVAVVNGIVRNVPTIAAQLVEAVRGIMSQISEMVLGYDMFDDFSSFMDGVMDILSEKIPNLVTAGVDWLIGLLSGFTDISVLTENLSSLFDSILTGISAGLPLILDKGIELVTFLMNGMMESEPTLITTIGDLLNQLVIFLMDNSVVFLERGMEFISTMSQGMLENFPLIVEAITNIVTNLMTTIQERLPEFLERGIESIVSLVDGMTESAPLLITTITDLVNQVVAFIMDNLPLFLEKGFEMVSSLVEGVLSNAPTLVLAMVDVILSLIENILNHLPEFLEKGQELVSKIIEGIIDKTPDILKSILDLLVKIIEKIVEKLPEFITKGGEIVGQLIKGIVDMIPDVVTGTLKVIGGIFDAFAEVDWLELGAQVINGIVDGLAGGAGAIWDAATSAAGGIFDAVCDFLGIESPSKLGRYIGRMFDAGIAEDLEDNAPIDEARNMVESVYRSAQNSVKDISIPISTDASGTWGYTGNWQEANMAVYNLLLKYLPMLANMQIVMQDKTVAGKLAPILNEELGKIAEWEAAR